MLLTYSTYKNNKQQGVSDTYKQQKVQAQRCY